MRHLLSLPDLNVNEMAAILAIAGDLKSKFKAGVRENLFPGRVMALVFQKPSLRTRVSFEAAMTHLGGGSLFLGGDTGFGQRESIEDFGKVLSAYVDVIVVRAFAHSVVERLADASSCSVINGLTDSFHPCQALADIFTVQEIFGELKHLTLAYVGDANNVARSLAQACLGFGVKFNIASPKGYEFDEAFRATLPGRGKHPLFQEMNDPAAAVRGAHVVYTDVWASMGQESEAKQRANDFAGFQVDDRLMKHADKDAVFMHCLPAHRGEEVSASVMDGSQSVVIQQAENRMHLQKGILAWLLSKAA